MRCGVYTYLLNLVPEIAVHLINLNYSRVVLNWELASAVQCFIVYFVANFDV